MKSKSIFVSSTFRDFQTERELLQVDVELRTNELLQHKKISFVDMRWGIDTSQEADLEKVVSICIAEVLNSRPYYVIMLGDSYGSTVERLVVEALYQLNGMHYDGKDKSVTEVEIEATGLLEGNNANAIVLIRDLEEVEDTDERAQALKSKVLQMAHPDNVLTYSAHMEDGTIVLDDKDEFIDFIANRVVALLEQEQEDEENAEVSIAGEEASQFCGRKGTLEQLEEMLTKQEHPRFFRICGTRGAGMTSVMSKLYTQMCQLPNTKAAISTARLPLSVLGATMGNMAAQVDISGGEYSTMFQIMDPSIRYYFFIDDSDEYADTSELKALEYKMVLPENFTFVLATRNPEKADYILPPLSVQDAEEILVSVLTERKKEIPQGFLQYFRAHFSPELAASPFLLKNFATSLCYLTKEEYEQLGVSSDFMQSLTELFNNKLCQTPQTEEDYLKKVLEESTIQEQLLMGALVIAQLRMSEQALLKVVDSKETPCTTLDFYRLKARLRENIRRRPDGCYELAHQSLEEHILCTLPEETIRTLRYRYVQAMREVPKAVTLLNSFSEMVYQAVKLQDASLLGEILEELSLYTCDKKGFGTILGIICGDTLRDCPSQMYQELVGLDNYPVSRFLLENATPYLSNLYLQNADELLWQMFQTLYQAGDERNAADAYALYMRALSFRMECGRLGVGLQEAFRKYELKVITPDFCSALVRGSGLNYDAKNCGGWLDFIRERNSDDSYINKTMLEDLLCQLILLDGNILAIQEQVRPFVQQALKLLRDEQMRKENPMLSVGVHYMRWALDLNLPEMDILPALGEETMSIARYALQTTLVSNYLRYMQEDDETGIETIAKVVREAIEENTSMGSADLLYLSRYFRRVCCNTPKAFSSEFISYGVDYLYNNLLDVNGTISCGMQLSEMSNISYLAYVYAQSEQEIQLATARLHHLKNLAGPHVGMLLEELDFCQQDISNGETDKRLIQKRVKEIKRILE